MKSDQESPPVFSLSRFLARALAWRHVATLLAAASPVLASAQQAPAGARRISLDDAVRLAVNASEAVGIARAGQTRAMGQRFQARSLAMPQVSGTGGYTKTLASQFSGLSFGGGAKTDTTVAPPPPALCAPTIPANATDAQRNTAIAQAITCPAAGGGGFDFSSTGFGAANQWSVGLNLAQSLYTGGRVRGQNLAADAQERSAAIDVTTQRAQAALDVTQAYFDAVLADQLVSIADSSLAQAEVVLTQTKLARDVGNQSEFDLLRAQVTRDNQVPVTIQAKSNRQVAYFRLKQLLELPLDQPIALSTELPSDANLSTLATSEFLHVTGPPDTAVANRAPVRQAEEAVQAQQALLMVAHSERLPTLSVVSGYQRLYFPNTLLPNLGQGRNNWTIGLSSTFSLFTGGRFHGDELVAQANIEQYRQQLKLTQVLAQLDTRVAMSQLDQADAAWRASQGTVEQAQRAYSIDEIRYREGISTQTDLAQSRLLIEQATANRAQAARDLAVARMRLQLLHDLPLQSSGGASTGGSTRTQPQQQPPQQQQQPPSSQTGGPPGSVVP